jgi:hypothetical protein
MMGESHATGSSPLKCSLRRATAMNWWKTSLGTHPVFMADRCPHEYIRKKVKACVTPSLRCRPSHDRNRADSVLDFSNSFRSLGWQRLG